MTGDSRTEYLILGMGALGSVFGGLLQDSGCKVTYVGRGPHFETALKRGLKITGIWGEHYISPAKIRGFNYECSRTEKKFPVILLCVKSMHTDEAAAQAATLLSDNGIIVSMQNGLKNWETIAKYVGEERTVGGRVIFGAEIPEPGTARVTVNADDVLTGAPFGSVNMEFLEALDRDLNRSGIPSRIVSSEDIHAAIWAKVLYNSALNPLGALFEVPYGDLNNSPETREIMREVLKEIFLVMERKGVKVPFRDYDDYYHYFIEKLLPPTAGHRASMLQDITRGRQTEIDALNGAIVQYAEALGIETPYNKLITHLIKFKEKSGTKSKAAGKPASDPASQG